MKLINKLEHLSYKEAERAGTVQTGEKATQKDLTNMGGSCPKGVSKDDKSQTLLIQENAIKHKKINFYCKGNQTLE